MPSTVGFTNRLAAEKSPYLLQHAHNPVDWYPWGDEAFGKAREEGKFVFLSIGYSTCHWCHVMERESFEDIDVAGLLNSVSVPVKVDREERPDVDQVYMNVCQALNGNGGWPLTVLLTPERVPFFAGTYFPKESRLGRMGLTDLLRQAGALWQQDPDKVRASAQELLHRLRGVSKGLPKGRMEAEAFDRAVETFRQQYDAARGGFGAPPKFPTPHNLVFLLRRYRKTGDARLLQMVESTLDAMACGGLYDHLGGGFHRYSTDADWLLPHFEKMLYDQAGLASAYLEAFQVTRRARWADVARSVFDYVLRDLRSPQGAFFCAEDADSEGVEGKFYVWSKAEILEALGAEEGAHFCRAYGVAEEGNFFEEATREKTGLNVLHLSRSSDATRISSTPREAQFEDRLAQDRQFLFERRQGRIRPLRDEKILAGWNGLMIAALAQGARVLGEPQYAAAAGRAADFVLSSLFRDGRLLRRWKDGEAVIPAFAEDYAFMAHGLLELYAATLVPSRLEQALHFAREVVHLFWDENDGGLFDTASDGETLVLRPREAHDGAIPSANSLALNTFARLWLLTGEHDWEARARGIADSFGAGASSYPAAFTSFLCGAALVLEPTREVVVAGDREDADTRALLNAVRSTYSPETTVLQVSTENSREISALAPFAVGMAPVGGAAAAYVCEGFACRVPIVDPSLLARVLSEPPSAP